MNNIKILENAYTAVIELANGCTSDDMATLRSIYHLIKFTRAAVRDFHDRTERLDEMFDLLSAYAAKLKRLAEGRISGQIIVSDSGEVFPLPVTNAHGAVIRLIRRKLEAHDVGNFKRLHDIAELYLHKFFEYSDMIDTQRDMEDWDLINMFLAAFTFEIGCHVAYLECGMRINGIPYNEIIV